MADDLGARMRTLSAHSGAAFEAGSVGRPRGEEPPLGHPLPAPLGTDGDERRDAGRERMRNPAGGEGGEAGAGAEGAAQASGSAARALPTQPEQERQQARVVVDGAPADDVSKDRHKKAWKVVLADQKGEPLFDYKHAGFTIQLKVSDDEKLDCVTKGCPKPGFGHTKYTRGESNVQKHIDTVHVRLAQDAAAAKPALSMFLAKEARLKQVVLAPARSTAAPPPQPSTPTPAAAAASPVSDETPGDDLGDAGNAEVQPPLPSPFMFQRLLSLDERLAQEAKGEAARLQEDARRRALAPRPLPATLERLPASQTKFDWLAALHARIAPPLAAALSDVTSERDDDALPWDADPSDLPAGSSLPRGDVTLPPPHLHAPHARARDTHAKEFGSSKHHAPSHLTL